MHTYEYVSLMLGQLCKVFWSKRIGLVACYCVKIARKMIKFYPPKSFLCPPNETLVINPSYPNHTSFQGSQSHFGAHSVEPLTSNSGFLNLKLNRRLLWYWRHHYKLFSFETSNFVLVWTIHFSQCTNFNVQYSTFVLSNFNVQTLQKNSPSHCVNFCGSAQSLDLVQV